MEIIKILVVDDEEEICELTRSFLKKKNYCTFSAMSADEAIGVVKKEKPHLVLLDVRLGDASGMEVLEKIKEIDRDIKVIMVTALSDETNAAQAKSRGAEGYIVKPFTAVYLDKIILQKIAELGLRKKENK